MNPKLIIFDADGTLCERDTGRILPGVRETIAALPDTVVVAIATNQGGVGLRYWMESAAFGEPEKYPTQAKVELQYGALPAAIGRPDAAVYMCFAYQSKAGRIAPQPDGTQHDYRWSIGCRKPLPGMLLQAMNAAGVGARDTLMVGDRSEDRDAAQAAGAQFRWAHEFFGES